MMITRNLIPKGRRGKVRKAVSDGNKKPFKGREPIIGRNTKRKVSGQELINAAKEGDLEKVKGLLEQGADVNALDELNRNALHWASISGDFEIAKLLIGYGVEKEVKDYRGWTPLHHACSMDDKRKTVAIYLIVSAVDINAKTKTKWTPLHHAARAGIEELVEILYLRGAEITNNEDGDDPRMVAEKAGHIDLSAKLLIRFTVDGLHENGLGWNKSGKRTWDD